MPNSIALDQAIAPFDRVWRETGVNNVDVKRDVLLACLKTAAEAIYPPEDVSEIFDAAIDAADKIIEMMICKREQSMPIEAVIDQKKPEAIITRDYLWPFLRVASRREFRRHESEHLELISGIICHVYFYDDYEDLWYIQEVFALLLKLRLKLSAEPMVPAGELRIAKIAKRREPPSSFDMFHGLSVAVREELLTDWQKRHNEDRGFGFRFTRE